MNDDYAEAYVEGALGRTTGLDLLRERALAACEDGGKCQHREGPDGWCDSCVAIHLNG